MSLKALSWQFAGLLELCTIVAIAAILMDGRDQLSSGGELLASGVGATPTGQGLVLSSLERAIVVHYGGRAHNFPC